MNDQQLAEIRERCEAASPGPWFLKNNGPRGDNDPDRLTNDEGELILWPNIRIGQSSELYLRLEFAHSADTEFLTSAREDIPALLAEVDRLRELVRHLGGTP